MLYSNCCIKLLIISKLQKSQLVSNTYDLKKLFSTIFHMHLKWNSSLAELGSIVYLSRVNPKKVNKLDKETS